MRQELRSKDREDMGKGGEREREEDTTPRGPFTPVSSVYLLNMSKHLDARLAYTCSEKQKCKIYEQQTAEDSLHFVVGFYEIFEIQVLMKIEANKSC